MSSYIEPIKVATLVFPFLALVLAIPFFIREYRRFGRFPLSQGVILYSFVYYLLCAYFLVILPLPARDAVAQMTGARYQLVFGKTLTDFLHQTVLNISDPSTFLPALKQNVFLEPMFNVLLFFPLGIYLRYYFKFSLKKTLLVSFCISLFFEVTQLTGLFFYYSRPYRLFDVNDLFNNTLGGGIGFFFAPLVTFMLPTKEQLDESSYEKSTQVTLIRRLVAFLIDWFIANIAGSFFFDMNSAVGFTAAVLLYFVLLQYLLKGRTPGKMVVKIRVAENGRDSVSLWGLLKRYGLLYLLFNYLGRILSGMAPYLNSEDQTRQQIALILALIGFGLMGLYLLSMTLSFVLRKRVLFYEKASRTHVVSTLAED